MEIPFFILFHPLSEHFNMTRPEFIGDKCRKSEHLSVLSKRRDKMGFCDFIRLFGYTGEGELFC